MTSRVRPYKQEIFMHIQFAWGAAPEMSDAECNVVIILSVRKNTR